MPIQKFIDALLSIDIGPPGSSVPAGGLMGQVLTKLSNADFDMNWQNVGGGGAPGGANTDVQFNDAGAFGGNAFFTYGKLTGHAALGNNSTLDTINAPNTGALAGEISTLIIQDRISEDMVVPNGNYDGIGIFSTYQNTGAGTSDSINGVLVQHEIIAANIHTIGQFIGLSSQANNLGSGHINIWRGCELFLSNKGTNTIEEFTGLNSELNISNGSGLVGTFTGVKVSLHNSSVNGVITAYGINIHRTTDGPGAIINNYGLFVDNQFGIGSTLSYNIFSDGNSSVNHFVGAVEIGDVNDAAVTDASLTVGTALNFFDYAFHQKAAGVKNRFDGTLEVLGHSAFGSLGIIDPTHPATLAINDAITGALPAGLTNDLEIISPHTNTGANNPSINGIFSEPQLLRATNQPVTNFVSVFARAYCDIAANISAIFGGSFTAYNNSPAANITGHVVGCEGNTFNASNVVGVLPYMAGMQTLSQHSGTQPVTNNYGLWVQLNLDASNVVVNNYGIRIEEQTTGTTKTYNLWSDWTSGNAALGKNFLGSGIEFARADNFLRNTVAFGNHAGAGLGTLTNAPSAGNPAKWIQIDDNGTPSFIPVWH